eukprot:8095999-Pyramimonas_sp.AAC.1
MVHFNSIDPDAIPSFRRSDAARCVHGVVHLGAGDPTQFRIRACPARSDPRSGRIRSPDVMPTDHAYQRS